MRKVARTYQLAGQQWHVLDDGQADPPFGVLCQLDDGRQQGLRELADADHLVHAVQVGDDVQTHLGALKTDENTHTHTFKDLRFTMLSQTSHGTLGGNHRHKKRPEPSQLGIIWTFDATKLATIPTCFSSLIRSQILNIYPSCLDRTQVSVLLNDLLSHHCNYIAFKN